MDLIHRAEGGTAHVLTTPLVTDEAGEKYGKSAGNAVWLAADMTSPYAFYQYWINVADSETGKLLRIFTDRTQEQIADLERAALERPHLREAQRALAADVPTRVHGAAATAQVAAASQVLFGRGEPSALDASTLRDATAELPGAAVPVGTGLLEAMVEVGLADSKGAARRLVRNGGVSINNTKVDDVEHVLQTDDFLHGQIALLRRGRKSLAAARNTL